MSQSLYTAMGGIAASQTGLNVIANNIANINTIAFKSSSVNFSEVYSSTLSSGTGASGTTGGINPMQVGLGVQVSSISKDYTAGTWVATGKTTDMMIQGNGFFTVSSADGEKFYTRAGDFSFDSDGDLVTADGYKVIGIDRLLGTNSSTTPVHIPQKIVREINPNAACWNEALTELNNCSLTNGDFNIIINNRDTLTLNVDTETFGTMGALAGSLQAQINAAAANILPLATTAQTAIAATNAAAAMGAGIDAPAIAAIDLAFDNTLIAADDALDDGYITQAQYDAIDAAYDNALIVIGTLSPTVAMDADQQNFLNGYAGEMRSLYDEYDNMTVTCDATTGGTIKFGIDDAPVGTNITSLRFTTSATNQSNFVAQTGLNSAQLVNNAYTSDYLDYVVGITQVTSVDEATSIDGYSIGDDGSVQATYANGDTLTVQLSDDGNTYEFIYTTAENVKIIGDKVLMDPNVATEANFVLQLASVTNNEGLLSVGNNLYSAGPNCGDIIYSVGDKMGLGSVASGGLEASNVDLSAEFSAMILAQRAVQANSRVFTTTSEIMDVVVNMAR